MKLFIISCYSNSGSHFGSYLQSVTIIAKNEKEAIKAYRKWSNKEGESFIYSKDKWDIEEKEIDFSKSQVINSNTDSDY